MQAAQMDKQLNMFLQDNRQHASINRLPSVMYAC